MIFLENGIEFQSGMKISLEKCDSIDESKSTEVSDSSKSNEKNPELGTVKSI